MATPTMRYWPGCGCCDVGGFFHWYTDGFGAEGDSSFASAGTVHFILCPDIYPFEWDSDMGAFTPQYTSYDAWVITASASKDVAATCVGGLQASSEDIFSIETRSSLSYLVYYDAIAKTEHDTIQLNQSTNDDLVNTYGDCKGTMVSWQIVDLSSSSGPHYYPTSQTQAGAAVGYGHEIRGTVNFEHTSTELEWAYHDLTSDTFNARSSGTQLLDDFTFEVVSSTFIETDMSGNDYYEHIVEVTNIDVVAPRTWPWAAGVIRTRGFVFQDGGSPDGYIVSNPQDIEVTPEVEFRRGQMQFSGGGDLDWPNGGSIIWTLTGDTLNGSQTLVSQDVQHYWDGYIFAYDEGKSGGYIAILFYYFPEWDDPGYDPLNDTPDRIVYKTRLYVCGTLIETLDADVNEDTAYSNNQQPVHAVHPHPDDGTNLFLVTKYNDGDDTWQVHCYNSSGSLVWSSSKSATGTEWTNEGPAGLSRVPNVGWSSDRWIALTIGMKGTTVDTLTGGVFTDAHMNWLVSHDGSEWIACGVRDGVGDTSSDPVLLEGTIRIDQAKNTRSMDQAIVPPATRFGDPP